MLISTDAIKSVVILMAVDSELKIEDSFTRKWTQKQHNHGGDMNGLLSREGLAFGTNG